MATITISIVSLVPAVTPTAFLAAIRESKVNLLAIARVVQWIVTPSIADHLLHYNWDFVLVQTPETASLPSSVLSLIAHISSTSVLQPDDFASKFIKPRDELESSQSTTPHQPSSTPAVALDKYLISTSTQRVQLTPALLAFARSPVCPSGPVSMLNFLSFHPFPSARTSYASYIDAFRTTIGNKWGGDLQLLGPVEQKGEWDEVAIAQYPSLEHFTAMMADPAYQAANLRFRIPALRDTCILMTTEVDLEWGVEGSLQWENVATD